MCPLLQPWYRHSPWSGNLYREAPDAWLWRFGYAKRDGMSAKSEIGKAVEATIAAVLLGTVSAASAAAHATHLFDAVRLGEVADERDDIPAIVGHALAAFQAIEAPLLTYQSTLRLDAGERFGLKHPIKCKTDFGYPDVTVDCKVTWRMPSEPKFPHVAQLGTYRAITGRAQALLYVTPRQARLFPQIPIPMLQQHAELTAAMLDEGWATMLGAWRRIDAMDRLFPSPEAASEVIPLNLDTYHWDKAAHAEARTLWKLDPVMLAEPETPAP